MRLLNRVILIGRLTRQPELRVTPSSVSVTSFTLAVDRRRLNSQGQRETDFIDIVMFGKLAEITCKYMDKGRQVAIEGRLQVRSYETKDGQRRKAAEVVADNIEFLGSRPKSGQDTDDGYDDLPQGDEEFSGDSFID